MKKYSFANVLNSLFLVIFMACSFVGCGGNNKTESQTVSNLTAESAQKVTANSANEMPNNSTNVAKTDVRICSNKYFPIADGNSRRYKITNDNKADETVYKQSYSTGANSFSETQEIKVNKISDIKVDWVCLPEGLRTATFAQLRGMNQIGMTLDSTSGTGLTLPKDTEWSVGKKWTSEYDLGGTFEMKPIKGNVTGKVTLNHEILAMDEKVTVPTGDYSTAKVKTVISMNINFQGKKLPSQNLTMTNWYAPEVGLVKQAVTGTLGTMTMDYIGK